MPTQFITIIGNVASGKSTIMPTIVEILDAHPVYADDLFQTVNPFREVYLKDMKRWSFTNELWMTVERAKIMDQMDITQFGKDIAVVDSGLLMSWVYTYSNLLVGNLSLTEWQFYEAMYDRLSQNFLSNTSVVFLNYSIPTLLKRLKKRGRDYELKYYTEKYLNQLDEGLEALIKKLKQHDVQFIQFDESEIGDFENSATDQKQLLELLEKRLRIGFS